jgi:transposase-like protein
MKADNDFKWRKFEGEIILWAVRWYCRYAISYRNLEEMMAERGIDGPLIFNCMLQALL